mmetsp:Transcript_37703/g.70532  ORF Transcript_37703/g.70532 Transcript_37703/m.70532 type:complete len:1065 (-) Transcript_37703:150-3344(-)
MQVVRGREQHHRVSLGATVVHQAAGSVKAPTGTSGASCYRRAMAPTVIKKITRAHTTAPTPGSTTLQQPQVLQRAASTPRAVGPSPTRITTPREESAKLFGALEGPSPLPLAWSDEFEVNEESPILGGGAFAEVFQVRHRRTFQHFAVKVMHRPNFTLRGIERQIDAEIRAMHLAAVEFAETKQENHIVRLLQVTEEGEYVFIMLELCSQGDLLRMLYQQPTGRFSEDVAAEWARQLLQGLFTLHKLGVIHRDIKPDNLLCTGQGVLKIADFGWCAEISEAPTVLAGTFQYMAPEVLQNFPQTEKADVWSAGVTLYQLVVGRPLLMTYLGPGATNLTHQDPHEATAIKQRWLVEEIFATCPPSEDLRPQDVSSPCWDFLRRLLVPEAEQRISVEEALWHPWLDDQSQDIDDQEQLGAVEEAASSARQSAREKVAELSPPSRKVGGSIVDLRSPVSDRTSASESCIPTPQHPRSWDPNRNMAYSPPVDCKEHLGSSVGSRSRSRSRSPPCQSQSMGESPNLRSPESSRDPSPELQARRLVSPERRISPGRRSLGTICKATVTAKPSGGGSLEAEVLKRLIATPTPCRAMAVPVQAAPRGRDSSNLREPKASPVTPVRTSQLHTVTAEPTKVGRPSQWSPSPVRVRGASVGASANSAPRPAPRLRLSAPGSLVESTQQSLGLPLGPSFGAQRGAPPPRAGTTGALPPSGYAGHSPATFETCRSLRLKQRTPTEDANALLNELRSSNENLRRAFLQLVQKMKKGQTLEAGATPEELAAMLTVADPQLRQNNGASSAPAAAPEGASAADADVVPDKFGQALQVSKIQNDANGNGGLDVLSCTAPAQHGGRENIPPPNAMTGKQANWSAAKLSGTPLQKPGTVQVRPAGLARYNGQGASGQTQRTDALSQTVHTVSMPASTAGASGMPLASGTTNTGSSLVLSRECNTPVVPATGWPRGASPEARSVTARATSQQKAPPSKSLPPKALPPKAQTPVQTLPPPRLALAQPQQKSGAHQRVLTALPVGNQPVWAYAGVLPGTSGQNTYRAGADERRRQSVPSSWFKRATST